MHPTVKLDNNIKNYDFFGNQSKTAKLLMIRPRAVRKRGYCIEPENHENQVSIQTHPFL